MGTRSRPDCITWADSQPSMAETRGRASVTHSSGSESLKSSARACLRTREKRTTARVRRRAPKRGPKVQQKGDDDVQATTRAFAGPHEATPVRGATARVLGGRAHASRRAAAREGAAVGRRAWVGLQRVCFPDRCSAPCGIGEKKGIGLVL